MQWQSSHLARPTLGSPSRHGWVWNDKNGVYDPVMTELSPALGMCKCTTGCLMQKCKFRKNGFVCFELCHCKQCKNIEGNLYPEDFAADCYSSFLEIDN